MTKISTLPRQSSMLASDQFLIHSTQNADDILITGSNMITSLDIVTNATLLSIKNSKGNRAITANTTLTIIDEVILASVSGGSITINLMLASQVAQRIFIIKKTDASANTITMTPSGNDLIDGSTTDSLSTGRPVKHYYSDGNNWHII